MTGEELTLLAQVMINPECGHDHISGQFIGLDVIAKEARNDGTPGPRAGSGDEAILAVMRSPRRSQSQAS